MSLFATYCCIRCDTREEFRNGGTVYRYSLEREVHVKEGNKEQAVSLSLATYVHTISVRV